MWHWYFSWVKDVTSSCTAGELQKLSAASFCNVPQGAVTSPVQQVAAKVTIFAVEYVSTDRFTTVRINTINVLIHIKNT